VTDDGTVGARNSNEFMPTTSKCIRARRVTVSEPIARCTMLAWAEMNTFFATTVSR